MDKQKRIRKICKKDNDNLNDFMSGKISRETYERKKDIIHKEYNRLSRQEKMAASCKRVI